MIFVVGAFCLDIIVEADEFLHNTSTPGKISIRPGGVAYNIYSHIEEEKRLVTAVGNDAFSQFVCSLVAPENISLHTMDAPPPMYVALMEKGELKIAASQMDAVERALDTGTVMKGLKDAGAGDIVILDANLHPDVFVDLAAALRGRCRLFFEPISSAKAGRHAASLRDVYIVTPDRREFEVLLGRTDPDDREVFLYLADRNIEYMLATRGGEGARLYGRSGRIDYPPVNRLDVSDSTGAGDMLTALLAQEVYRGASLPEAVPGCMAAVEKMLAGRSASG